VVTDGIRATIASAGFASSLAKRDTYDGVSRSSLGTVRA
jgi:hypothetical protein